MPDTLSQLWSFMWQVTSFKGSKVWRSLEKNADDRKQNLWPAGGMEFITGHDCIPALSQDKTAFLHLRKHARASEGQVLGGALPRLPISAALEGSTATSLGSTFRKRASPLTLMARPEGLTTTESRCIPTGSRSVWQTTFVSFEKRTLQIVLFTVTSTAWGSPEKLVPKI